MKNYKKNQVPRKYIINSFTDGRLMSLIAFGAVFQFQRSGVVVEHEILLC